jgi:predicted lysophospholipase L1 biosynthesis ABC-type transport system permease subunit
MSCCGKKRESWLQRAGNEDASLSSNEKPQPKVAVYFEYTGETGLTAVGSFTRNRYHFNGKGDRQAVDYRDASGMMAVPMLRRVRSE